jgi:hypothetical protein
MPANQFYIGETATFNIEIRNSITRDLVDPDSVKITIENNDVLVDNEDMEKVSVGIYTYDYVPDLVGDFTATYKITDGGKITIAKDLINVIN